MTDRDVMKAAVEALEQAHAAMREPTGEWHDIKCNQTLPNVRRVANALRAHLAQPEATDWQEEARRYASNADFWRSKYEALRLAQPEGLCCKNREA